MKKKNCRLKEARKAKGMSQTELAGRSGISISYMRLLDAGWARPSEEIQSRLADVLECKPGSIFTTKKEK